MAWVESGIYHLGEVEEARRQGATSTEDPKEESMDAVVAVKDGRSRPLYPQNPQAGAQTAGEGVGNLSEPQTDAECEPLRRSLAPPLPGDFLMAEYESDCARFVADARNLARRRTNRPLLAQ